MKTLTLNVDGMTCGHCVKGVTQALTTLAGVADAKVSLEQKNAHITYDPAQVTPEELMAAIAEEGYQVSL